MDESTHDLLIKELQKYFTANMRWEQKKSHMAAKEVRRYLSEIRRLATIRRDEVQQQRKPRGIPRGNNIVKYNSDRDQKGNQDT